MKLSKSQVHGFITALLGCETMSEGSGDSVSPLVTAYLSGVLPVMVYESRLFAAMGGCGSDTANHERDVFCDFLEAVVAHLRGVEPAKESLPFVVSVVGESRRTTLARFRHGDDAAAWALEKHPNRASVVDESEKQS